MQKMRHITGQRPWVARPLPESFPLPAHRRIFWSLGINPRSTDWIDNLPFVGHDITAGTETELQVAVAGKSADVDLPQTILRSNYFKNISRRMSTGDLSPRAVKDLKSFLENNPDQIWENSWVRVPQNLISNYARRIFHRDLLADKDVVNGRMRSDAGKFIISAQGAAMLRLPVSYLIKLALADAVGAQRGLPEAMRHIGERLMRHMINDNSSPESSSFHIARGATAPLLGDAVARETAKRYLLTQLLCQYANRKFRLMEQGQEVLAYFSPHPPTRQKALNECISDSFYRELFMSPCLSGWNRGEEKQHYMHLCHQVLSRSHLNSLGKLREAGIITRKMVIFPNTSNISLANNGTHVTIGSRRMTLSLKDADTGFTPAEEKQLGDLTCKIMEHFLPLFVGTFSAAPYRLDFTDFYPERALGFLPHQLDYTHLRMLWRRWRIKAELSPRGTRGTLSPRGPVWLDRLIARSLGLRGDYVKDFRLLDYPVALLSTESSPAFNGRLGNQQRLKKDLSEMGVFDDAMSFYCLYRLREFNAMGFSGFEGRYYSLFPDLRRDLAQAVAMQQLITALAFKYMALGQVTHRHIPDCPIVESERRQIFFGAAIGIPTFFVRNHTPNRFLQRIIDLSENVRGSHRYSGYRRIGNREYCRALLRMLRLDAPDLVERLDMAENLDMLEQQINEPSQSAAGRLGHDVMQEIDIRAPLSATARQFNLAAEKYYRNTLRRRQMHQALETLKQEAALLGKTTASRLEQQVLSMTCGNLTPARFCERVARDILAEQADWPELAGMINILLLTLENDRRRSHQP